MEQAGRRLAALEFGIEREIFPKLRVGISGRLECEDLSRPPDETGELERVGSSQTRRVDVRVLSATNANLPEESKAGNFREDPSVQPSGADKGRVS